MRLEETWLLARQCLQAVPSKCNRCSRSAGQCAFLGHCPSFSNFLPQIYSMSGESDANIAELCVLEPSYSRMEVSKSTSSRGIPLLYVTEKTGFSLLSKLSYTSYPNFAQILSSSLISMKPDCVQDERLNTYSIT